MMCSDHHIYRRFLAPGCPPRLGPHPVTVQSQSQNLGRVSLHPPQPIPEPGLPRFSPNSQLHLTGSGYNSVMSQKIRTRPI